MAVSSLDFQRSTGMSLAAVAPGVLRPSATNWASVTESRATTAGFFAARFVLSPESLPR